MKKFLHSEKGNYFNINVDWQNGTVLSSKNNFVQKYALTGHENLSTALILCHVMDSAWKEFD